MLKGEVHLRLLLFCPHIDSIVVCVCVVVFLGGERGGGGVELSLLCLHIDLIVTWCVCCCFLRGEYGVSVVVVLRGRGRGSGCNCRAAPVVAALHIDLIVIRVCIVVFWVTGGGGY